MTEKRPGKAETAQRTTALRAVTWLGMLCVYSGIPWLVALIHFAQQGILPIVVGIAFCLAGSVWVGVGLCAAERWGWAAATCLFGIYTPLALVTAGSAAAALVTHSGALSWQPVFAGLTPELTRRVALLAALLAGVSVVAVKLLWTAQSEFDVPYRRPFTTLVEEGAFPAALIVAADVYLLYQAWLVHARL